MTKILIIFGTRPEAIKMAPLVHRFLQETDTFDTKVCITSQHRQMMDQVLDFFNIKPDYDLNLMKPDQNLYNLTADIIVKLKDILEEVSPDYIFVHGDTTTSMAAALAGFYNGAKVCHVEAGLRTYHRQSPFPEEINRQLTGRLADYHFAPTLQAEQNLRNERISPESILVTGNTVIDALLEGKERLKYIKSKEIDALETIIEEGKRIVLVTGHRRENIGDGFIQICIALKQLAQHYADSVQIIYPVHLNPKVRATVMTMMSDIPNVRLVDPLSYPAFLWLMLRSYLILTDSGGIQEEAPSLGKPVLVLRNNTERPEAVEAGTVILVGTDSNRIFTEASQLLDDNAKYTSMSMLHNPYGDGEASTRIVNFIKQLSQ